MIKCCNSTKSILKTKITNQLSYSVFFNILNTFLCLLLSAALVVRFLTRRFIWEYDPTLGKTSLFKTPVYYYVTVLTSITMNTGTAVTIAATP